MLQGGFSSPLQGRGTIKSESPTEIELNPSDGREHERLSQKGSAIKDYSFIETNRERKMERP